MAAVVSPAADEVFEKLLARTREGKVRWRPGVRFSTLIRGDRGFEVDFADSSVVIRREPNGFLCVQIYDEHGYVAEEFRAGPGDQGLATLNELYEAAQSHAGHGEKVLEGLSRRLDALG